MIQRLIERGVPATAIATKVTPGRFRRLDGEHTTDEAVQAALAGQYPDVNVQAWFTEHAIVQDGATWLVRRIWGRATEPTLITLRDAFPEARVSFQRAAASA